MISVKCPACGLVDWNKGDCKRCGASLVGVGAEDGYVSGVSEWAADARSVRTARRVMAVCVVFVLALSALGALYLAHKPAKPQWFWSFYRSEPSPGEVFAHNVEVSGGAARVRSLRSFRAEGRISFVGGEAESVARAAGGGVTIVMHVKEPNKVETELEIGAPNSSESPFAVERPSLSSYMQPAAPKVRVNVRRGFNGTKGWEYVEGTVLTPGSTVPIKKYSSRELVGDELEQMKRFSQTGLVQLDDGFTALKLVGRVPVTWGSKGTAFPGGPVLIDEELRGHEAYVVSGINNEGREEKFYFDTLTGLLLRANFGEEEKAGGAAVETDCVYGDYKEVGGLKLPHTFYMKNGEESVTITIEKYLPNDPIPDSTFEMPE
jgi:hypothetical protein